MGKRKKKYYFQTVFLQDDSGLPILPDASGKARGYVPCRHRRNVSDFTPYCIPNEIICTKIGAVLGLPVPPCAITHEKNEGDFYSALDFNFSGVQPPPIIPEYCFRNLPKLCTGIILFDILIANEDRHEENLAVDKVGDPKAIEVFDHDQALFGGGGNLKGIERLKTLKDRLGITGGSVTGGSKHCLLNVIDTSEYFDFWIERFCMFPQWIITEACESVIGSGIDKTEAKEADEFLRYRSSNMIKLIDSHRNIFPLIKTWQLTRKLFY